MFVLVLSATEIVFLAARAFGANRTLQITASVRVLKAGPFGVVAAMLGNHTMQGRAAWLPRRSRLSASRSLPSCGSAGIGADRSMTRDATDHESPF